jgi:hypothetical protein
VPAVAFTVTVYVLSTVNEYAGRDNVLESELVEFIAAIWPLSCTAHAYVTGMGGTQLDRVTDDRIVRTWDDVMV